MNKMILKILLLGFSINLFGCAASGPIFTQASPPNGSSGLIYIYRKKIWEMSARTAYFSIDGKQVAALDSNGYAAVYVEPGKRVLSQVFGDFLGVDQMDKRATAVLLNVSEGETYFVKLNVGGGGGYISWNLESVPSTVALAELKTHKLQK